MKKIIIKAINCSDFNWAINELNLALQIDSISNYWDDWRAEAIWSISNVEQRKEIIAHYLEAEIANLDIKTDDLIMETNLINENFYIPIKF